MDIQLDHVIVHSADRRSDARLLAELLGVRWSESAGRFSPVFVGETLTLDFDETNEPFPIGHFAFRVSPAKFEEIVARIRAAGIAFRGNPGGPMDGIVGRRAETMHVYWEKPEGHVWEILTHT